MFTVVLTIKHPGQPDDTSPLSISDKDLRKLAKAKGFRLARVVAISNEIDFTPFPGPAKVAPIEFALAQTGATIHIEIERPSTRALSLLGAIRYGSKQESTKELAPKPARHPRARQPSGDTRPVKLAPKYDHLIQPGSLAEAVKAQMVKVLESWDSAGYSADYQQLLKAEGFVIGHHHRLSGLASRLVKKLAIDAPNIMVHEVVGLKNREDVSHALRHLRGLKISEGALSLVYVTLVKLGHTQYAPK